jgi:hypothetical protein
MPNKIKVTKKMLVRRQKKMKVGAPPFRKTGIRRAPTLSSKSEGAFVAQSTSLRNRGPRYSAQSNGDIEISHEEYIGTITGSTPVAISSYAINPGNPLLFPWLSLTASQFEKYNFKTLQIVYRTRSATSNAGAICYAVDYDASDPAPTSMVQARNYRSAISDAPWKNFVFEALREDLTTTYRYVRNSGALPANTDLKLYDTGNLAILTEGNAAGIAGELSVVYRVCLHTPQMQANPGLYGSATGGSALTASNLLGTSPTFDVDNTLPISSVVGSTQLLQIPVVGTYLVTVTLVGTVLNGPFIYTASPTNCTVTVLSSLVDAGALNAIGQFRVQVTGSYASFTPKITSATTVSSSSFQVTAWSPSV